MGTKAIHQTVADVIKSMCDLLSFFLFAGNTNPFAILEVGNSRVRTQSAYKSINPTWDKTFHL